MCDNNFPSLVASLFSWRCLGASTSYFLHAAMNLRPPSVTVSTHTSALNAVAFQSPAMPNARMSLWTQSVHSFSSLCVYKSSEVLPSSTAPSKCQCIINSILSSTAPSPRHGASICPSIRAAPQHLGSTVHDFALNYLPRNHQQRSRHGSYSRDSDARPFGTIRNDYPSVKLPFHGVVDTSSFYGVSRCNII